MLGLSGTLSYAVFVYLCMCILYLRVWHMGISFFISLNNPLFKNIPHVRSFWHFVICCICVFVYFVFVFLVFARLTHGNIIFDTLEQSPFQKYTTCLVFLALCHMPYLCICVIGFLYLCIWHVWISFWISLNNPLFKNMSFVGSFRHLVMCCICVFVFVYFCMRHLGISV